MAHQEIRNIMIGSLAGCEMENSESRVVYENGAFRPLTSVSFPEHKVLVLVEKSDHVSSAAEEDQSEILAVLAERYSSGASHVAERHNTVTQ